MHDYWLNMKLIQSNALVKPEMRNEAQRIALDRNKQREKCAQIQ